MNRSRSTSALIKSPAWLALAGLLSLAAGAYLSGKEPDPPTVTLTFQNTLAVPVDIYCARSGSEPELYIQQLEVDREVDQPSHPGNVWTIKTGQTKLAEYTAGSSATQEVDLEEVAGWQAEIELVIANTLDGPVDILWFDEEKNEEVAQTSGLQPGRQYVVRTNPGSRWLVRADGKTVAEYLVNIERQQNVQTKDLAEGYANTVIVTFQNTTSDPVSIAWMHPDGHEVEYVAALDPGSEQTLEAYPKQPWIVRRNGALVLAYVPHEESQQVVDIAPMAAETSQRLADIEKNGLPVEPAGADSSSPKPPPPRTNAPKPPPPRR